MNIKSPLTWSKLLSLLVFITGVIFGGYIAIVKQDGTVLVELMAISAGLMGLKTWTQAQEKKNV